MCVKYIAKADRYLYTIFIERKVKYFCSVYLREKLILTVLSKCLCRVNSVSFRRESLVE